MNKYLIFTFLLVFCSIPLSAQKYIRFYRFNSVKLGPIDLVLCECNALFSIEYPSYEYLDMVTGYEPFSMGKFKMSNGSIRCYDSKLKRLYLFKQLNDSTLVAMKHTFFFVKGDKLQSIRNVQCYDKEKNVE